MDIMKLLLDKKTSVNLTNTEEFSPLRISVQFVHLEATKFLVERSAAINNTNKYGNTPLMLAACNDILEIFHYFTEIGADIYKLIAICITVNIVDNFKSKRDKVMPIKLNYS